MRGRGVRLVVLLLGTLAAGAQERAPGLPLTELMQALQYAELVRAAALTPEQLAGLAQMQSRWSEAQRVPDAVADAVQEVCLQVLRGRTTDEAMAKAGDAGRQLGLAQQQLHQASQEMSAELVAALTAEQRRALAAYVSPIHGLSWVVTALRQGRQAPPEAWAQMRPQLDEALGRFGGPQATAKVPEATRGEWLDRARGLPAAEFEKAASGLPEEWAKGLAPELVHQLDDPAWQEQRLQEIGHRLFSDPAGPALVGGVLAEGRERPAPAGQ